MKWLLRPTRLALALALALAVLQQSIPRLPAADSPENILLFARTASLRAAISSGNTARVQEILDANPQFLHARDLEGSSLLHIAAQHDQIDSARLLHQRAAPIEATNNAGNTPLHAAAAAGRRKFVEWLLSTGAKADAINGDGRLPLELADISGHRDLARFLRLHLENSAPRSSDSRISLAILPLRNQTPHPDQAHWEFSTGAAIASSLGHFPNILPIDRGAIRHALQNRKITPETPISLERARDIGQQLEARRVLWGSFQVAQDRFALSLQLLNVATGQLLLQTNLSEPTFQLARNAAVRTLAAALELSPTANEWALALKPKSKSDAVYEPLSRAFAAYEINEPLTNVLVHAERALALDPECSDAHIVRAIATFTSGDIPGVQKHLENFPAASLKDEEYHVVSGAMHLMKNNPDAAEKHFRAALRVNPKYAEALDRLAELYGFLQQWESAIYLLNRAKQLDPSNSNTRAALARAFAHVRDREAALRELAEAQRLDPDNVNTLQLVPDIYEKLGDIALAVDQYEKFLRVADRLGVSANLRDWARRGAESRSLLTATPIPTTPPKRYSQESLRTELNARLTPEELARIVNPLADTPAMKQWARDLTKTSPSDEARARALFQELSHRIQLEQGWGSRSAVQVFESWNRPDEDFSCNELAKLYIALAREAGLQAFYTHLEEDVYGRIVYHDCAAVFLEDRCYLVDPAYRWFGVPHRKFQILDDVQTIAHSLAHIPPTDVASSRRKLSILLHPDSAWTHIQLARSLIGAGALAQARSALDEAARLEPNRWDEFMVRGILAAHSNQLDDAEKQLAEGLKRNPSDGQGRLWHAEVLQKLGRLREARDDFRLGLGCLIPPNARAAATRALILLNEEIGEP